MKRRRLLQHACALPLLPLAGGPLAPHAEAAAAQFRRCLPGDPVWPTAASSDRLNQAVGGRLAAVVSPLAGCSTASDGPGCAEVFKELKNPYYIGDSTHSRRPAAGSTAGRRRQALMSLRRARRRTSSTPSTLRAKTGCAWRSRGADTAIRERRTPPARC